MFHVLNRGIARMQLFEKRGDYEAFERTLCETLQERPMRICAYCVLPNHWHFLLWPEHDGDLAKFMQRFTIAHVRRWQEHRHHVGLGHVYQGRYKSFPVEDDEHFLAVARYVERNALRANLVEAPSNGAGRAYGVVAVATPRRSRSPRPGQSSCPKTGSSKSTVPTVRRNWKHCAVASVAGVPTARPTGSNASRNVSGWNLPIVRPAVPELRNRTSLVE